MSMENMQPLASQVLEDLRSEESEIIRDAAFRAGDMVLADAVPLLCERIKSENIGIQEAAEYGLRKIRGPETVMALLPLLRSNEAPVRNVAMDILREIGLDAIEEMKPWLRDDDADVRIFISDILGYCSSHQSALLLCEALLKDPEVNVRYQAAVSLGNLAYPETVGDLSRAMHDEEWVQFAVVEALAKINDTLATKALVQLLPQSSPLVCSAIIDALGGLGDLKTIPMLFNSLESVSTALRHKIVKAIVQILSGRSLSLLDATSQERLHVYLMDALTDNDEEILCAALQGLGAIGAEQASDAILRLAADLDPERKPELCEACIQALGKVGYNDVVRAALESEDERTVSTALEACRLMNDRGPVEALKTTSWRLSQELQRAAVALIAHLGNCDDVPFFMSVIDECEDPELLKSALIFFGNQHACPDVADVVFNQLDHRYVDVKEMALEACINLHSPILNERFKERFVREDPMQRMMAVYALGRYSVMENITEITAALEDENPEVRQVAVECFVNLGRDAEAYLPNLLPRLFDENKDVRAALVTLLGQIGTPTVFTHLVTALRDENDWVRIRAAEGLGANKHLESVPLMAQMLEYANPIVAFKVIEVLGKMGGNVAFSVLLGMMDHEDPEIQQAAAEAVAAIQAGQE